MKYKQLLEMAAAFGVRLLGAALQRLRRFMRSLQARWEYC